MNTDPDDDRNIESTLEEILGRSPTQDEIASTRQVRADLGEITRSEEFQKEMQEPNFPLDLDTALGFAWGQWRKIPSGICPIDLDPSER